MANDNVLKGAEWHKYLKNRQFTNRLQMELYRLTHNYEAIYQIGEYYFCFSIHRGYKNLTSLKRLL